MTITTIKEKLQETDTFKKMMPFKKTLTLKPNSLQNLLHLHFIASKHGIGYLKQRVDLNATDVRIVEQILQNKEIKNPNV